ncbi:MAG: hypothetical protein ACREIP_18635 [Alphaproteobacteria bacterium]
MDWYLIGRILGVIFWPLAAAALVYIVGRLIAASREPQQSAAWRRWVGVAAGLAYLVTLFATGLHLLRYLRVIG